MSRCYLKPNEQFPSISWQCVSWRKPGTFYEILMMSNLMTDLDFHFGRSLKQQSTSQHVAPLGHIILIPKQPAFDRTPIKL